MNILEIYNPANAKNLTEEQVTAMKDLTDDQIKELAEAYPNQPTGNAYLRYYDTNEKPTLQRYALGTWKNLASLRKLGQKHILPFGFVKSVQPVLKNKKGNIPTTSRTIDLGADEKIEGLKSDLTEGHVIAGTLEEGGLSTTVMADKSDFEDPNVIINPHAQAYTDKQAELDQAKADKAHHMTIKRLENELAALKEAAEKF